MSTTQEVLEILLDTTEPQAGVDYQIDNGDRYQVTDILDRLDSPEKVVILRKLPQGDRAFAASTSRSDNRDLI